MILYPMSREELEKMYSPIEINDNYEIIDYEGEPTCKIYVRIPPIASDLEGKEDKK